MSIEDLKKDVETDEHVAETTTKVETEVEAPSTEEAENTDEFEDDEDYDSEDSLTFSNGVIEKIVALAMRDVPGVVGMKGGFINRVQDAFGVRDARRGVTVEVTPDSSVRVNISVFIAYGAYAPQVLEDVKHAVVNAVTGMTGLEIAGVNLRIEDVLTPEEIEERSPKLPAPEDAEPLPEPEVEVETAEPEAEAEVEEAETVE
jgi:uncharacterized alkaline shock family protein YloU